MSFSRKFTHNLAIYNLALSKLQVVGTDAFLKTRKTYRFRERLFKSIFFQVAL